MTSSIRGARRLSIGTALAAVVVAGGIAQAAAAPPAMNDQESLDMARQALDGATVQSVELDTADGTPQWEVDIRTRDGASYEVTVDAANGKILSIEPSAG